LPHLYPVTYCLLLGLVLTIIGIGWSRCLSISCAQLEMHGMMTHLTSTYLVQVDCDSCAAKKV